MTLAFFLWFDFINKSIVFKDSISVFPRRQIFNLPFKLVNKQNYDWSKKWLNRSQSLYFLICPNLAYCPIVLRIFCTAYRIVNLILIVIYYEKIITSSICCIKFIFKINILFQSNNFCFQKYFLYEPQFQVSDKNTK